MIFHQSVLKYYVEKILHTNFCFNNFYLNWNLNKVKHEMEQ